MPLYFIQKNKPRKIRHYIKIRAELFETKFRSRQRERETKIKICMFRDNNEREIRHVNDVIDTR